MKRLRLKAYYYNLEQLTYRLLREIVKRTLVLGLLLFGGGLLEYKRNQICDRLNGC